MIKRQYTLYLENRPGALAEVARSLSDAGLNIEGISVAESTDAALVQVVVGNSAKTKKVLEKAKIPYTSQNVAIVLLDHKPGALAEFAEKLADQHVNINYIYATAADNQDQSCLVISGSDLKKIERLAK